MIMRISQLLAVVALAIGLASCGGNTDNASFDMTPAVDNTVVAGQSVELGSDVVALDKETASIWWKDGMYVLTSGADTFDGVDFQYKLWGDNHGKYLWQFVITRNRWNPATINYDRLRRYTFKVEQNGVVIWNSNPFVHVLPAGSLTLQPYMPVEFVVPWNGTDRFHRKIQGNVFTSCVHRPTTGNRTMTGWAWLNGV